MPSPSMASMASAWCALPAACALSLAGCAGNSSVERGIDHAASGISASFDGAVTEERNYVLPVDGIVDLDVETFGGDVVVRSGQETKGEARIDVVVGARHGGDRKDEAQGSLQQVALKAEIRRGGDVPTLVVRGTSDHDEAWLHRTDIDIQLPEVRRVRIKTRAGKVHVFENRGGCRVDTTDGEVRVLTPWAITEDIALVTRGAEVVLRAFTGTCGTFDVETVNGRVLSRVEAGDWRVVDRRNGVGSLHATLGTGTNRIVIRDVDGDVKIGIVKNPMEHGTFFPSP